MAEARHGTQQCYVVSPHATISWRQGRIRAASGAKPRALILEPEALRLLGELREPRSAKQAAALSGLPADEVLSLLALLVETGIVEVLDPADAQQGPWWDPFDRGRDLNSVLQLIQVAHGFARSADERFPVDAWGRPTPWVARPIIDFLFQLNLSSTRVFEFGGGASTHYWRRRCGKVTCVESSPEWSERLSRLGPEAEVLLRTDASSYAGAILERPGLYDIILIDAAPAFRSGCVGPALKRLDPRGMIILDDAPFYPEAAAELRRGGLIEVDFTGYSPLENNLQTTAIFLSREFDLPRRQGVNPVFPFGSPGFDWDDFRLHVDLG